MLSRAIYMASGYLKIFTVVAVISYLGLSYVEISLFGEYQDYWYQSNEAKEEGSDDDDPWAECREMDAESLMYQQRDILDANLKSLQTGKNDKSDMFYVGFAGYAIQDVFFKEVTFAKNLFDTRFLTQGHSINLINHLSTRETIALANATNLAATLKYIGSLMDTEQDIIFLYLTSHGSKDHQLSVLFWPLRLNNLTPEKLNTMLDEAGIKWRIVIVSSCYSGGFIEALENEHTLIATAAAADKKSFGCSNENDFTYFGEALFKDRLSSEYSIISALEHVQTDISEREARENLDASNPQLVIGASIQNKLEQLGNQLKMQQCQANAESVTC
ncbi:MAG: C13 family peptidase [Gammaproteobacteria bacterium]|nr:C13 family peptidase [Gammaproteobacteria bacterium]